MKYMPTDLISAHWKTLGDARKPPKLRVMATDLAVQYALPVVFGVCVALWAPDQLVVGVLFSAVAIFTGLVFNLTFNVTDKAIDIRRDEVRNNDANLITLVDTLRSNLNYTSLVGITLTLGLGGASMFATDGELSRGVVAVFGAMLAHLLILCLVVLRRFVLLHDQLRS